MQFTRSCSVRIFFFLNWKFILRMKFEDVGLMKLIWLHSFAPYRKLTFWGASKSRWNECIECQGDYFIQTYSFLTRLYLASTVISLFYKCLSSSMTNVFQGLHIQRNCTKLKLIYGLIKLVREDWEDITEVQSFVLVAMEPGVTYVKFHRLLILMLQPCACIRDGTIY